MNKVVKLCWAFGFLMIALVIAGPVLTVIIKALGWLLLIVVLGSIAWYVVGRVIKALKQSGKYDA